MTSYRIETIQDMFAIPAADRGRMLKALEVWLGQFDVLVKMKDRRSAPMHEAFYWNDEVTNHCWTSPLPANRPSRS